MFWRKKKTEQYKTENKITDKVEQPLDNKSRFNAYLKNSIYLKIYYFTETLEGKELFPDFLELADKLERDFYYVLKNKAEFIKTVSDIEPVEWKTSQKAKYYRFLSDLLIDYKGKASDADTLKVCVLLQTKAENYLKELLKELEEVKEANKLIIIKSENENQKLKRENELLWKKIEKKELLKIDLKDRVKELEAKKKLLEETSKETRLQNHQKTPSGYPPHLLKQIIDTAVRLSEIKEKVLAVDIYSELQIEKKTYNKRIKYFGFDTPKIIEEARRIIREKERGKKE